MAITFELSKPLAEYPRALREWSVAEVRPYARQADTDHAPPKQWSKILDTCPVPLGRTDKAKLDRIPIFPEGRWTSELVFYENLNYGDLWPLALPNTNIGHLVVEATGTPEQVERWYRPAAENGVIWSSRSLSGVRIGHFAGCHHGATGRRLVGAERQQDLRQ
jgi:acyl-CoA dehydrogenase